MIGGAAQHRKRRLIIGKRLVEPAEQKQDRASLRLGSGPGHATQAQQRSLDLPQCLPHVPAHVQGKGQAQPGLGREFGSPRVSAQPDRRTQMPERSVRIFQLQGRQAECPLGYRERREVTFLAGLVSYGPGQHGRFTRVCLYEPERLTCLVIQRRTHSQL